TAVRKFERDVPASPAVAPSAGRLHEEVADQAAGRAATIAHGCGDDPVLRPREEGNLVTVVVATILGSAPGPVLVEQVAEAEVLDPGTPQVDEGRPRARLCHSSERPSQMADPAFQGSTEVRSTQVDDVTDPGHPPVL